MRRIVQTLKISALVGTTAATAALCSALPAQAGDQIFRVDLNKTEVVRLPASAGSIVIGNPAIADVSIQSPNTVFVVGRGYGETNLIVMDRQGRTMMDADIQVTSVTPTHGVRLFNGSVRQTYSCAPYCQPSPILGDDPGFIGGNSGAAKATGNNTIVDNAPESDALADTARSNPAASARQTPGGPSGFPQGNVER